jgi:hypothetical protein
MKPDPKDPRWGNDFKGSEAILREVGLEVRLLDLPNIHARG